MASKDKDDEKDEIEIIDWNDMRRFDDDHDDDWFSCQQKKLAEQYGGNFVKVKYADHGRVSYYCELCYAECNAKKSLELHCAGMKHLKKKDLWEKEGKPQVIFDSDDDVLPSFRDKKKGPKGKSPPRKSRKSRPRSRSPYNRPRSPYERSRSPYDRRGPWNPPSGPPRPSFGFGMELGPPSLMPDNRIDRMGSGPFGGGPGYDPRPYDRNSRYVDDGPGPDPYMPYKDNSRGARHGQRSEPPRIPSPPTFKSDNSPLVDKPTLTESPAGNLLQKLSECCVKTTDDADLALNVVAALAKSLKEYSQRNGESKIAELLMEAELKIGTVKALKVGMKMLSSFADSTNSNMDLRSGLRNLNDKPKESERSSFSEVNKMYSYDSNFTGDRPFPAPAPFNRGDPQMGMKPSRDNCIGYPDFYSADRSMPFINPAPRR